MQKQYNEIKQKYPNEILFFRMGDFYEMFGEDAKIASKILNITLTARHKNSPNPVPMCGIPYHAVENYTYKLTKAGKRVAICEQASDPTLPGLVKREVVRVVTPGTTMDDKVIDDKSNNYLLSLFLNKDTWGFAICDLTTGEFQATQINEVALVKNEVLRLKPSEVIVPANLFNDSRFEKFLAELPNLNVFDLPKFENASRFLCGHFNVKNLSSFGLNDLPVAVEASGLLLGYLKETQKTSLDHLLTLSRYALENFMVLDHATIRNLEIFQNAWDFSTQGSLLEIIDKTHTAMGGRLLRKWLLMPLINQNQIEQRLDAEEKMVEDPVFSVNLIEQFKNIADFERIIGKIGINRANARDFVALKVSLQQIPLIKESLKTQETKLLQTFYESFPDHAELVTLIETVLFDEPAVSLTEGGLIRDGYDKKLDELRKISKGGKEWLSEFQAKEIERTKITTLKVKYNKVFGYYIEISKGNIKNVPVDYIRKQTLVNAERYITPELKEYEDKILGAEEKIKQIEYQIFLELREKVIKFFSEIQVTAKIIAQLDVLLSFSLSAKLNNYTKPEITNDGVIKLFESRHPVIENFTESYVSNDLIMDHKKNEFILLTGPNMSGKSSFLRQIALNCLLAQIGSFVPAQKAVLGVVDRIFTRVGASDNLSQGVSTFMNEMQESANILNNATKDSLIILDEIGRGTSTFDGVSIAWAIIEYIHDKIQAKTLFATHYHELVDIIKKLNRAENYCVAVSEDKGKIIFLHKIIKGSTSQSYGIEVAKLAGLPEELVNKASEILLNLETKSQIKLDKQPRQASLSLSLHEEKLKQELEKVDVNNITPLEALHKLNELKKETDKMKSKKNLD